MFDPDQGYPIPIGKAVAGLMESKTRLVSSARISEETLEAAARHATLLLGCFRTGDANDPEVYTSAVVAVLSRYPEEVMCAVSDPSGGLPGRLQWLPSVKEVRDACQLEFERLQRLERLRAMKPEPRRIAGPASKATVFVPAVNPKYAEMIERTTTADPAEFRREASGVWVAENWLQGLRFKP